MKRFISMRPVRRYVSRYTLAISVSASLCFSDSLHRRISVQERSDGEKEDEGRLAEGEGAAEKRENRKKLGRRGRQIDFGREVGK